MQTFILHTHDLNFINWRQHDFSFLLSPGAVDVWLIDIERESILFDVLKNFLDADETLRLNRFKQHDDRLRYAYAHAGLRILCSRYLNLPAEAIEITETFNKKPCIKINDRKLFFNLSHSGRRIIIAFGTNSEVGVDVEQVRPDFKIDDFMERNYSENEIRSVKGQAHREQQILFFKYWSRKESWLKATGTGIFSDLSAVDTSPEEKKIYPADFVPGNFGPDFYIYSCFEDNYWMSICINHNSGDLKFFRFDFNAFLKL